ncbi:unnamed protein product [Mytilus edulis]|uniref:Mitochondria-eating protein C-terminal domain-containing protein n=1 Tax=Mytilus edulis TaxID=6550 RepID=A0A8S3UYM7_MYTED|nr:unnamed protein product [Mytilus edulis]
MKIGISRSKDNSNITSTTNEPEQNEQLRTDNPSTSNAPSSPDYDRKLQNDVTEVTNITIEPQKTDNHSISNAPSSPDNDQKLRNDVTEVTNISIETQNQPTPDVLDGDQSSYIAQHLSDCNERPKSNDLLIVSEKNEESIENGAEDNIRVVSPAQHTSTKDAINVGNASEEKPSSRQDRPSSADLFLASSVVSKKKNEDDKIRQEQEMKFQDVMTEEAQRLETYCNSPNFKHSNFTQDNSLCPPAFLQKVIYETCRKKAKEQVGVFLLLKNPSSTQVKEMWSQIPSTERQNFTDSRKRMAEANINMLQKIIINDEVYKKKLRDLNAGLDKEILGILENSSYFEKCVEICWQFVIQDPPLFLDIRSLTGETINKDTHKEYTKSGAVIKYVVWPALYLHCKNNEKGALLAKGVVQPES